jgi:hypothetical protein
MGAREQREHGDGVETSAHTSLQVEKERSILVHRAATALGRRCGSRRCAANLRR